MPTYTYEGESDRYYPTLALTPEPGGQYELERNPGDSRWSPPDPEPAANAGDGPADEPAAPPRSFGFTRATAPVALDEIPPQDPTVKDGE